ncbi:RNA-dependent RNA polymerase [Colletotrichum fructicola RNA virus 1]|nr:RNA-dependent RNA polymerase [Colletotrichum fructicola RNA virus 1]
MSAYVDVARSAAFTGTMHSPTTFDWAEDVDLTFGPALTVGGTVSRSRQEVLEVVVKHLELGVKACGSLNGSSVRKTIGVNICDEGVVADIEVCVPSVVDEGEYVGVGKKRVELKMVAMGDGLSREAVKGFLDRVSEVANPTDDRNVDWAMEVVDKASRLRDPSMVLCKRQLPSPFVVSKDKSKGETLLRDSALAGIGVLLEEFAEKERAVLKPKLIAEASLGTYTRNDPEKLRKRILRYCNERIREYKGPIKDCVNLGVESLRYVKMHTCGRVRARAISSLSEEEFSALLREGSSGEYKYFGVKKRKDPALLRSSFLMIKSFLRAAEVSLSNGEYPLGRLYPEVLTVVFGKKETVSNSMEDGKLVEKVQRCIFDGSPVPYAVAAFLFDDVASLFKKRDPTFGPGYGKARGNDWKVVDFLNRHFPEGVISRAQMIMADVKGWDTTLKEAIISILMDFWESFVDKTHLNPAELLARKWLVELSLDYLLRKIIAHPSGFAFTLYGCMPSGSWFTSNFNTDANTIFFFALCYHISGKREVFDDVEMMCDAVRSNGDNQLGADELVVAMGGDYTLAKHQAFFKELGLELKPKETMVSNHLSHVAYCSTKYYRLFGYRGLNGPFLPIRPWTLILPKLCGQEFDDPLMAKFYIRQLMIDSMGTDPLLFEYLSFLDQELRSVDATDLKSSKRKVIKSLRDVTLKLTGELEETEELLSMLMMTNFSRDACLTLVATRTIDLETEVVGKYKMGPEFLAGMPLSGANREMAGRDSRYRAACTMSKDNFLDHLRLTGQVDVLLEKGDFSEWMREK